MMKMIPMLVCAMPEDPTPSTGMRQRTVACSGLGREPSWGRWRSPRFVFDHTRTR
jgi:hypothetical protein